MPQSCRSTSANLAFQQKAVGEQLVARHAGQLDVFDRMAERPVAQVVQQGRGDEQSRRPPGVTAAGEPLVVGQLLQVQQRQAVDAQASARSGCGWPPDRPATPAPTG